MFGMFVAFVTLVLHTNQAAYEDDRDDILQFAALLGVFMVTSVSLLGAFSQSSWKVLGICV